MANNPKQNEKLLDKIIIKNDIELENKENALEVIDIVRDRKLSASMFNIYPEILNVKASKVSNIIDAFEEEKLDTCILEKNPFVIEKTNASRISKVKNTLEKLNINLDVLKEFPEIIAIGKDDEMEKIAEVLEKHNISKKEYVKFANVLAYGTAEEIDRILDVLEKTKLKNIVLKKDPSVLYYNDADIVEDLIKLYDDKSEKLGINILKKNPEILAQTTRVRVQAIINMLERNKVPRRVIVEVPEIVYTNETKEIEEIISKLKDSGIPKEKIVEVPEVLTYDTITLNKLIAKLKLMSEYDELFAGIASRDTKAIVESNISDVREYIELVEKGKLDKNIFKINPKILSDADPENVLKVVESLEEIKDGAYYVSNPEILLLEDPDNIIAIHETIEEYDLPKKLVEDSAILYLEGDSENIEKVVEEILKRGLDKNILNNPNLLIKGEAKNVAEMLAKIANDNDIKNTDIEKNLTVITEGDPEEIKKINEFFKEKNLLNNPEVEIPSVIYSKGKIENIISIYNFMYEVGLLEELKSSMSLFVKPYKNIYENLDILVENGMLDAMLNNISILGLNPEMIESRIIYLKQKGIEPTAQSFKLSNAKFSENYDIQGNLEDKLPQRYYAEEMIDSNYSEILLNEYENEKENDYTDLSTIGENLSYDEKRLYEEILKEIISLGIVTKNLEYAKCNYSYSMIKIRKNLEKLVAHIKDIKDVEELDKKDYIYIESLAVLGNKKMQEDEAEIICKSIIRGEKEISKEYMQNDDLTKIKINVEEENKEKEEKDMSSVNSIKNENSEVNVENNLNNVVDRDENNIDKQIEDELYEIYFDNNDEGKAKKNEKVNLSGIVGLEDKKVELETKKENDIEEDEKGYDIEAIEKRIEKELKEREERQRQKEKQEQEQNYENYQNNVNYINDEENDMQYLSGGSMQDEENILGNSSIVIEKETYDKLEETERNKRIAEKEAKIKQIEEEETKKQELIKMKENLEMMRNSLKKYTKEISEREIENEIRKKNLEKERIEKIAQRRQAKELEKVKAEKEELEKAKIELEKAEIKRKIEEEAKKLAEEKLKELKAQKEKEEREARLLEEEIKRKLEEEERKERLKLIREKRELELRLRRQEEKMKQAKIKEELKAKKKEEENRNTQLLKEKEELIAKLKMQNAKLKGFNEKQNVKDQDTEKEKQEKIESKKIEENLKRKIAEAEKAKRESQEELEKHMRLIQNGYNNENNYTNDYDEDEYHVDDIQNIRQVASDITDESGLYKTYDYNSIDSIDDIDNLNVDNDYNSYDNYDEYSNYGDNYNSNDNNYYNYIEDDYNENNGMQENLSANANLNNAVSENYYEQSIENAFMQNDNQRNNMKDPSDYPKNVIKERRRRENVYNPEANPNIMQNNVSQIPNVNTKGNIRKSNSFDRTMDAYYDNSKKPFFGLEDYGYIVASVDDGEEKKMQLEMNELYKQNKRNVQKNVNNNGNMGNMNNEYY